MQRRKSRRIEDSDEEIPRSGPDSPVAKKERLDDSDDDMPLFGPNGLAKQTSGTDQPTGGGARESAALRSRRLSQTRGRRFVTRGAECGSCR